MKRVTRIVGRVVGFTVVGVSLALLLYAYCAPVVVKRGTALKPRDLTLAQAKDYYAVLSAWTSLGAGIAGVLLGYFYFKSRLDYDDRTRTRDRQRVQLNLLLDRIDRVDQAIGDLLAGESGEAPLHPVCQRIFRELDQMVAILEDGDRLLGLNDDDLLAIVKLNSFVEHFAREKHDRHPIHGVDRVSGAETQAEAREEYADRLQEARARCIRRIC